MQPSDEPASSGESASCDPPQRAARTDAEPLPAFDPRWRVEKFLLRGRLERMPRRQEDRGLVRRWLAASVTQVLEPVDERTLTARLAELVRDPVGARRDLVDAGLVTRTRDGAEYWRTHVTEFDAGSDDEGSADGSTTSASSADERGPRAD